MTGEGQNLGKQKLAPPEGRASARPVSRLSRHYPIHLPPIESHNLAVIIFVTACTAKRRKVLASPLSHGAIVSAWSLATKWLVGRYVILPDHVHFFCAPSERDAPSLETWMRYWKSIVSRNLRVSGGEALWQRGHWDRQLRRAERYDEKWEYVRSNPVRHGLISKPDDWPYQGELNLLRW